MKAQSVQMMVFCVTTKQHLVSVRRDNDWLLRQNLQACIFEYGLAGCFAISFYDLVCFLFGNGLIAGNNAAHFAEPRCASTHGGPIQLDWKYKSFPMPMDGGTSRTSAYPFMPSMRLSSSLIACSVLLVCSAEYASSTTSFATTSALSPRHEISITITPVSITPVSISPVSITPVSIPSLSLHLPVNTCTPGATSYATPASHGYVPAEACNALWQYSPSFATAIIFSVLFGALAIAHLAQALVYRNGFCWVVIMAALWETGAYVSRALGAKDQQSSGTATVAQILVLVAPICECCEPSEAKDRRWHFLLRNITDIPQGSTLTHTW